MCGDGGWGMYGDGGEVHEVKREGKKIQVSHLTSRG